MEGMNSKTMSRMVGWAKDKSKKSANEPSDESQIHVDNDSVPDSANVSPRVPSPDNSIEEPSDANQASINFDEPACLIPLPPKTEEEDGSDEAMSPLSDSDSDPSALEFDHEPFSLFQYRVVALALFRLWHKATPDQISVEPMSGGRHHRVIGLNYMTYQHVVRVPWVPGDISCSRHAGILKFIDHYAPLGSLYAPRAVDFDDTSANPLGSPFMAQRRLPGVNALDAFPTLRYKQRRLIARQLGAAVRTMTELHSRVAGHPVIVDLIWIHVTPFQHRDDDTSPSLLYERGRPAIKVKKLMLSLLDAQTDPETNMIAGCIDMKIVKMIISELHQGGWLSNIPNCLVHPALLPHNLLLDTHTPRRTSRPVPVLSGILGWDKAVLGPAFMACVPPMWLWAGQGVQVQEDDKRADDRPAEVEDQVLKYIFEAEAGPLYQRFAYKTPYRLARKLMKLALEGGEGVYVAKAFMDLCVEWIVFTEKEGQCSGLTDSEPLLSLMRFLQQNGLEESTL